MATECKLLSLSACQLSECSPKIGFLLTPNPSQGGDSVDNTRCSDEQDSSTVKNTLKLTRTKDCKSLKSFVCNNLKLQGQWCYRLRYVVLYLFLVFLQK